MALDPRAQALALLLAGALGLLLGLSYDLLRPPRRSAGAGLGALLDLLFGVLAACGAYLYAMGAGEGRLGLWELTSILLGFLVYLRIFSPLILPVLSRFYKGIQGIMESLKKLSAKLQFFAKKPSKM